MKGSLLAVLTLPFAGCCAHMCGGERLRDALADVRPIRTTAAVPAPAPRVAAAAGPVRVPAEKPVRLRIRFESGKSSVGRAYDPQLKKVADYLARHPRAKARIEGHSDNVGSAQSNKALSQRRAQAVRQALIDRARVDPKRLTAAGFGPDRPLADNATPEGRVRNRRVVAVFQ